MKITKIEKNMGAIALDFEVPNTHSYLLKNGIMSHNSLAGILSYSKDEKEDKNKQRESIKKALRPEYVERIHSPKRPKDLECDIHQISVNKEKHVVLVGKLNGSLY